MADLLIVLVSGEDLEANLARSLAEPGPSHPWAFAGQVGRKLQAVRPGAYVAFLDLVDQAGHRVRRFTRSDAVLSARRVVLGRITEGIARPETPFFPLYEHEFRFTDPVEERFDPMLDRTELVAWLNDHIAGLGLIEEDMALLLKDAKSSRFGAFVDGARRGADSFAEEPSVVEAVDAGDRPVELLPPTPFGEAVVAFAAAVDEAGLVFRGANEELPEAFLAAVAAKPFVILSGLSGSGKTQLARALGQWLGADRYLVVPVRPDWTSPDPLLGYEDALLPSEDGRRAWTAPAALRFLLQAAADPDHLHLLMLDEMNLAHVERYFADVLSGIESRERVVPALVEGSDGYWRVPAGGPDRLPVPANVIVVGTVNIDETTYQFSPKVLDRAFTFDFRVETAELSLAGGRPAALAPADDRHVAAIRAVLADDRWHVANPATRIDEVVAQLTHQHERLSEIGFEFGHRTFQEAGRLAATLAAAGLDDADVALDWILMTKVLPRLHGSRRQLEGILVDLVATAEGDDHEKPQLPNVARKARRMLDLVRANQFVSFAE